MMAGCTSSVCESGVVWSLLERRLSRKEKKKKKKDDTCRQSVPIMMVCMCGLYPSRLECSEWRQKSRYFLSRSQDNTTYILHYGIQIDA